MSIVSIAPAGSLGILKDSSPAELPPTAWSDGKNVQFIQGQVVSAPDAVSIYPATPIPFNTAIATPVASDSQATWLLAGAAKIYAYTSNILTDVSRAVGGAYTGGADTRWTGGVLGGVGFLNNGVDLPQAWLTADPLVKVIDLANWPSNTSARCLRSYKQYLVALDITKAGVRKPTLVKWSHPADPGTVPISWNETDPTKDAGEYPLSETAGSCIDCLPLRDVNLIYKQDSVWGMQYVGGTYVFRFYKVFGDFGVPQKDCVVEYVSGRHFVFTGNDMLVHDGQTVTSVASGKIQKLFKTLSAQQLQTCYVALSSISKEVWVCLRLASDSTIAADTAVTYNWESGAISLRTLPDYVFVANGRLDPPVSNTVTWETALSPWNAHAEMWGEAIAVPSQMRMLGITASELYWVDALAISTVYCWVERLHQGVPVRAGRPPDLSAQKFLTRIWPRFTGRTGDTVTITLGASDSVAFPPVWEMEQQFRIGIDAYLDCTITGKLFSIRLESVNTAQWTYAGMDAEVIASGN